MIFDTLHRNMTRRLRRFSLMPVRFRKRHQLQLVMALMSINILISLSILSQQSKLTSIFDNYITSFRYKYDNNKLLKLLDDYRSMFKTTTAKTTTHNDRRFNSADRPSIMMKPSAHLNSPFNARQKLEFSAPVLNSAEKQTGEMAKNSKKIRDYYFNGDLSNNEDSSTSSSSAEPLNFYSPRILIENPNACRINKNSESASGDGTRRHRLFMISLIHSHANNDLRRKTMRETWLSMSRIRLSDLYPRVDFDLSHDYELHFAHLFIVGIDQRRRDHVLESIRNESRLHNDILLIDLEEDYKNLVYKHLALVDWVSAHCENVSFVLKMDDDVLVNIKSLARHLIERISPSASYHQKKFLYCNINRKSVPVRRNSSKWFVHPDTYPFEWYPKYCEGFAYITNLNTIRFMSEQSRRIPRFWIDDVYFTGLLFHGIDDVKWIDYKVGKVEWAYYDFWDLGNTLSIYELYAYILKLFNINAIDYYKSNHFVILHTQLGSEEVNYTMTDPRIRSSLDQTTTKENKTSSSLSFSMSSAENNRIEFCKNSVLKYATTLSPSEFVDSNEFKNWRTTTSTPSHLNISNDSNIGRRHYTYLDCLDLVDDRKFILNVYFYEFCHNLWKNSFV